MPREIFLLLKVSAPTCQAHSAFPYYLSLWKQHDTRSPEQLFLHDSRQTGQMFLTSTGLCKRVTVFTGQNPRDPVPGLVHSVQWTQWQKKRASTQTKRSWGPHICASAGRPSSDLILPESDLVLACNCEYVKRHYYCCCCVYRRSYHYPAFRFWLTRKLNVSDIS
jgi:hypothetical protein